MKLKLLWLLPEILIGFTLVSIPITFAQFTTQAKATNNTFSTASSFITPTPTPTGDEDDPDCDGDDSCATPTPTPPCRDCDHDCDKDGKCKPQVIVNCEKVRNSGDDNNKSDQDKYDQCEDGKHKTHLTFFNNSTGFFVTFSIDDAKNFKHLKYDLQYTHDGIVEDIVGAGNIFGDTFTSDPVQLGTCSTSVCINHKDAHDFKLTITLSGNTYHQDHHDGKEDHDVSYRYDE